ncbi:peroxiredoxin-like 2C [Scleropages formosus]|uniref:Peroxiredoxin like 2C n=1 Tax=Scleropages formosus TaxID=113540 RepID=A0A8C9U745_SCLFO|nr:peroxiredoxin-like 2C [Scleropages formosus]
MVHTRVNEARDDGAMRALHLETCCDVSDARGARGRNSRPDDGWKLLEVGVGARSAADPVLFVMASEAPVTRQVRRTEPTSAEGHFDVDLSAVRNCTVLDRHGARLPFGQLYKDRKAIVVFVRNFLCYICKEYVEDLAKIPPDYLRDAGVRLVVIGQSSHHHIEPFCSLTKYQHEIYVDPERSIYKKLGMRRGEAPFQSAFSSPHVKSSVLTGSMRSIWRAMTSPVFDFQGDPHQQGGALIAGPGPEVHFAHFDMNRLDHTPINWLLQLADVQMVDFRNQPRIIDV